MTKKNSLRLIADSTIVSFGMWQSAAQPIVSDQWAAANALGRRIQEFRDAGNRMEKLVAIFYWTWHQGNDDTTFICNR